MVVEQICVSQFQSKDMDLKQFSKELRLSALACSMLCGSGDISNLIRRFDYKRRQVLLSEYLPSLLDGNLRAWCSADVILHPPGWRQPVSKEEHAYEGCGSAFHPCQSPPLFHFRQWRKERSNHIEPELKWDTKNNLRGKEGKNRKIDWQLNKGQIYYA